MDKLMQSFRDDGIPGLTFGDQGQERRGNWIFGVSAPRALRFIELARWDPDDETVWRAIAGLPAHKLDEARSTLERAFGPPTFQTHDGVSIEWEGEDFTRWLWPPDISIGS